jgi:hypothetical protein
MSSRRLVRFPAFIAIVAAVGVARWLATRPPVLTVQGEVNASAAIYLESARRLRLPSAQGG